MIEKIYSYLLHPAKHIEEQPYIRGAVVKKQKQGKLFEMLREIYNKAAKECNIEIVFSNKEGIQQNDSRDLIIDYLKDSTIDRGRKIAHRLQMVTTHRSGLGLLFLINGSEKKHRKLVISRFPADKGILASEGTKKLTIEFIERIFMKSSTAYKSALYIGESLVSDFWDGRAIDRQINSDLELSKYWINEFLLSDLCTTSCAGSRRIAIAVRDAMNNTNNLDIKEEFIAVIQLLRNVSGQVTSAADIVARFGLTEQAAQLLVDSFPRKEVYQESFKFNMEEFDKYLLYRSVELNNGAILIGVDSRFDQIFKKELVEPDLRKLRFTTEGIITDQKMRKRK